MLEPDDRITPTERPRDTGYAPQRWAFDGEVTKVFEDMLWRSIPGYAAMRQLCEKIAARHIRPRSTVVDLGCSRGGAIANLIATVDPTHMVSFVGAEISDPMLEAARDRFKGDPMVRIDKVDLRRAFPEVATGSASVVMAILTLQFVPIEHRARVVRRSREALRDGGVLIVVEKVLGETSWGDDQLIEDYYDFKRANGYSDDEIDRKRLALEGILVSQRATTNVEMLRGEGFHEVEQFWQHLNFCGWIARR